MIRNLSRGGGGISNVQSLIDIIADKVVNKLVSNDNLNTILNEYILKSMMSNINTNSTENIPTSSLVYNMNNLIIQNLNNIHAIIHDFEFLEENNSMSKIKRIGLFCFLYIIKTPFVKSHQSVLLGKQTHTFIGVSAVKIVIGDNFNNWNCMINVLNDGSVMLTNGNTVDLPNAWYKGSAIIA